MSNDELYVGGTILVRAKIVKLETNRVRVVFDDHEFDDGTHRADIMTWFDKKNTEIDPDSCPPEPEKTSILRDKNGGLWTYRNLSASSRGWNSSERHDFWKWGRQMIDRFGPFEEFTSDRRIGG